MVEYQLYGLEAMRGQVHRIAHCLDSDAPWVALARSFPELARTQAELVAHDGLSADEVKASFIRLYRTYVKEWETFMSPFSLAA